MWGRTVPTCPPRLGEYPLVALEDQIRDLGRGHPGDILCEKTAVARAGGSPAVDSTRCRHPGQAVAAVCPYVRRRAIPAEKTHAALPWAPNILRGLEHTGNPCLLGLNGRARAIRQLYPIPTAGEAGEGKDHDKQKAAHCPASYTGGRSSAANPSSARRPGATRNLPPPEPLAFAHPAPGHFPPMNSDTVAVNTSGSKMNARCP